MPSDTLLFLAHRLPYPPNKGDKVRSYHLLQHLARRYRVVLGAFVDDPADWPHVDKVRALCAEIHVERIVTRSRRWRAGLAVLTGESLTLPYFRSATLIEWVRDIVCRERIERAVAFSSPMAQYVLDLPRLRTVVDFVDLDSAKWADYARRRPWPLSALYRLEARRLLAFEKAVARRVDASVFVTREEAQLLGSALPECGNRILAIENGVDSDYFSPRHAFASPFRADEEPVVFTGAMGYWPNIDAVAWFAREVLPRVRERDARVRFHIVGMNPDRTVRALARDPAISVTGRVDDVRPYLAHARVVVAPLRVARGIQNKVLEAMAMGRPTVVTSGAARALSARAGLHLQLADEAEDFSAKVLSLIEPATGAAFGRRARAWVENECAWDSKLRGFDELLAGRPTAQSPSVATRPLRPTPATADPQ